MALITSRRSLANILRLPPVALKAASQLSFVIVEINKFSMFGTISMSRHEN
jgi:hypothetical protein